MILITGGLGFLGHHLAKSFPDALILDANTYAAQGRYFPDRTFFGDIADNSKNAAHDLVDFLDQKKITTVIHTAAETHVDRSFGFPDLFVKTNIGGTLNLLNAIRHSKLQPRLIHVSTDEVYGSNPFPVAENAAMLPGNPYAASKAGADAMVLAYCNTYGTNAVIARFSNFYGIGQYPEKLIPRTIKLLSQGKPAEICGDGANTRQWLHVWDAVNAIAYLLKDQHQQYIYNFRGEEFTNSQIVQKIVALMGGEYRFVADRPGNDRHYRMMDEYARILLRWHPVHSMDVCLPEIIDTYKDI